MDTIVKTSVGSIKCHLGDEAIIKLIDMVSMAAWMKDPDRKYTDYATWKYFNPIANACGIKFEITNEMY